MHVLVPPHLVAGLQPVLVLALQLILREGEASFELLVRRELGGGEATGKERKEGRQGGGERISMKDLGMP